jgi:Cu/Zn superoxide dismutase
MKHLPFSKFKLHLSLTYRYFFRFNSPVAGSVWFTALSKGDSVETKILTNLINVAAAKSTANAWQIFITDILDTDSDIQRGSCDFLQLLYDPLNKDGKDCSEENRASCREGDLTGKFGKVKVGKEESMFTKIYVTDVDLELPELDGHRSLYLVLFDEEHPESFLACAKIRQVKRKVARASFSHEGVKGAITFTQPSPFQPVETDVLLTGLGEGAGSFHVHEFPVPARLDVSDSPCGRTGNHFNPTGIDPSASPKSGEGSFDKYELGDLSGKYGDLSHRDHLQENVVDPTLTLFGPSSIIGRSIVIHKSPVPKRWFCANIDLHDQQLVTAVATFTYPIAGRVIFRQAEDEPFADTTVFVESLLYSDGSKNDSRDHRWHVHVQVPGKDFFNWTGRCLSAGGHYNPHKVNLESYTECSSEKRHVRCEVGDLVNKLGLINVAGRKRDSKESIKFFTDSNLPLSGPHSIIGRSSKQF